MFVICANDFPIAVAESEINAQEYRNQEQEMYDLMFKEKKFNQRFLFTLKKSLKLDR